MLGCCTHGRDPERLLPPACGSLPAGWSSVQLWSLWPWEETARGPRTFSLSLHLCVKSAFAKERKKVMLVQEAPFYLMEKSKFEEL